MSTVRRVLLLSPSVMPDITGNAVTVERWRSALSDLGVEATALATSGLAPAALAEHLGRCRPDVVHAHHLVRAGALLVSRSPGLVPGGFGLVVSPAGTDVNGPDDPALRELVGRVVRRADAIVIQNAGTRSAIESYGADLLSRTFVVPKAFAWLGRERFDLREITGAPPGGVVFFVPAGIRPVKGNLELVVAFDPVHRARPWARIVFAGPVLDPEYGRAFADAIRERPGHARWVGTIPLEAMRSAYGSCDVVVNGSTSEGLANALLEAAAAGKPILASRVTGNLEPVLGGPGDEPAGLLFDRDGGDFACRAVELIDSPDLRQALGRAGSRRASRWPTPAAEAAALLEIYERIAARSSTRERSDR